MSLAIVHTRARLGIEAPPVTVEVHLSNGLPGLSIVGLPETAVKESKDRVRSAIINSQFEFPARRITINLAPADLPKEGGRFDLPIAIGILAASGQIPADALNGYEFLGELALTGDIRPVKGVLTAAIACGSAARALVLPVANTAEAQLSDTTKAFAAEQLLDVCRHLHGQNHLQLTPLDEASNTIFCENKLPDFADIYGQQHAKRALEIAAAGGHNVLLYGPPGTGKTMLASRLPSIMPPLNQTEAIETASIYSLNGEARADLYLPPYRAPHHTASAVALVGGGSSPKPGEISLANNGVLFLDELPEFQRQVLEVLREPMESGEIRISRAIAQLTFPAKFQMVAAMNPCPCGFFGDNSEQQSQACRCTQEQVQRYRQKISGPLLDRIDLHIAVNRPSAKIMTAQHQGKLSKGESSAEVRGRVIAARKRQQARQHCNNAQLAGESLRSYCPLNEPELNMLERAIQQLGLSTRAYHRVIKVARTIADLAGEPSILQAHIAEALSLRNLDRAV